MGREGRWESGQDGIGNIEAGSGCEAAAVEGSWAG